MWPDGPGGDCVVHDPSPNTAVVLDTDTVFHGVDPVGGPHVAPPPIDGDAELRRMDASSERWRLVDAASCEERATYDWDDVRLSISWKAYCFADEAERDAWRTHGDDLTEEMVVDRLVADLHGRGIVEGEPARDRQLGQLLIDTYVRYPSAP